MRQRRLNVVWMVMFTMGAAAAAPCFAGGQCEPQWHPFTSGEQIGVGGGFNSLAALTVWNGDLIAGGWFDMAGGQTVYRIARWDGVQWHPFQVNETVGVNGDVFALTVWNGDLIIGGFHFSSAGGIDANRIARWDGSTWHPFTAGGQNGVAGANSTVRALTVWNGHLIAAGSFTTAGGQTVNHVARWDGSAWHPLTSGGQIGVGSEFVYALTVWNGDLIAAGSFTSAGGQEVNRIARWDGSAWHPLTSGGQIGVNQTVYSLTVWNGDLVVGGLFSSAGGQTVNYIARWDGSAWHPLAVGKHVGTNSIVYALSVWNGHLIAGGLFTTAGGQTINRIARWDGSAWHPFIVDGQIGFSDGVSPLAQALTVWNSDLVAGGTFLTAGGQTVNRIARWDDCLEPPCAGPGDINCDGIIDVFDLIELLAAWGDCPEPCQPNICPADITDANGTGPDCVTDVFDLIVLLENWTT